GDPASCLHPARRLFRVRRRPALPDLRTFSSTHRRTMTDPIARFAELLERAQREGLPEPTAMALATADASGRPAVRMVLLKAFGNDGFVFYTNLESRKAGDLAENPRAALCFHWVTMEAQVRV